jgi:NitT/TauT family transport system substrate-binding protein
MPRGKVQPLPKIFGLVLVGLIIFFGIKYLNNSGLIEKIAPTKGGKTVATSKLSKGDSKDVIKVGVVTWGGYAGGQYFNGGFKASKESRYYKEYEILVEFLVMDDFNASRAAWKKGEVDFMWFTADALCTEVGSLKEYDPQVVFQADWSRGGDAIVVKRGINNVSDLRGKTIAVAYGQPSNTFILWMLKANGMTFRDVQLIKVNNAIDAATMFKAGKVDAAVVWSPDDQDCISKVPGSKILKNTKDAPYIIADVFYARRSYIEANPEKIRKFVEGWLRGAAEINSSEEAKQKAAKILAQGLGQDYNFCLSSINNARLCTFGDNKGFFTINGCNACVTGEQLYTKMVEEYTEFGLITSSVPDWRLVSNTSILRSINLSGPEHEAEEMQSFTKPTVKEAQAPAFASKSVNIVFPSGSARLSESAISTLDNEVVPILKAFASVRVRVEGNTDDVGAYDMNKALSYKRAKSPIEYLVTNYYFDVNRFIVIGNGPDKPVAQNDTDVGRAKNRRTEFQLLN